MDHFGCVVVKNDEIEVVIIKKIQPLSDEGAARLALILLTDKMKL